MNEETLDPSADDRPGSAASTISAALALRSRFAESHPEILQLDEGDPAGIQAYLLANRLAQSAEFPARIERAGSGNMNLTLRVTLAHRRLILKQGRPWVEKYDHIEAPWDRTLVEGSFYEAVRDVSGVADHMPSLLALDRLHHVLALSDVGSMGDLTSIYADGRIEGPVVDDLLDWLKALGGVAIPQPEKAAFANRAMRALNHEHMFRLPLASENGLELDRLTPGLARVAHALKADAAYLARVSALGRTYLEDGAFLVHGDYFPGSWIRAETGIRIIDPEFCFLGSREFDYGVMLAHLALAQASVETGTRVLTATKRASLNPALVLGIAGVEIMRRLIGVAQLPLTCNLDAKRRLLDVSRSLVLRPEEKLRCW